MYYNITVRDLKKIINNNIKIIDIRDPKEVKYGIIPNSINIPMIELITKPSLYLRKKEMYYIYCASGIKSNSVCYNLSEVGYNVTNVLGGYRRWIIDNE
jgi:rhodanese-related sulfurtransferase